MEDPGTIRWLTIDAARRRDLVEAIRRAAAARDWVDAAWLFGSAARGDRPARDVDVAVLTRDRTEPPSLAALADLVDAVARDTGLDPGQVDVRIVDDADPVFLGTFVRDAILAFERDRERRIDFVVRAHSLWLDYRPVWERLRREALKRWSNG
ncbi:MAG: nucleotidyltransferase domain-containing protein [Myxococcota bacterium]